MQAFLVDGELNVENGLRSWRIVSSNFSMASPIRMTASGRSTRRAVLQRQPDGEQALNHESADRGRYGPGPRSAHGRAPGHGDGRFSIAVPAAWPEHGPAPRRASEKLRCRLLVGQVRIPVDLAVDPDGDAEERRHGRVVAGNPKLSGLWATLARRIGLSLSDQGAEDPASGGTGTDGALLLVAQPDGQELLESLPVLGQHAEGPDRASTRSLASSMTGGAPAAG